MQPSEIAELFAEAKQHLIDHDCSAHPYEQAEKLSQLVVHYQPKNILEIGTGFGFTALVMAKSAPGAKITTVEKDPEHVNAAQQLFAKHGVSGQIQILEQVAEHLLPTLNEKYDLIFFDGYGIHYEFLPQYHRLLSENGVAVIANNQLTTKTSDQFFAELHDTKLWRILEQFGDTTLAIKIT